MTIYQWLNWYPLLVSLLTSLLYYTSVCKGIYARVLPRVFPQPFGRTRRRGVWHRRGTALMYGIISLRPHVVVCKDIRL
jgi:hypothetical protein